MSAYRVVFKQNDENETDLTPLYQGGHDERDSTAARSIAWGAYAALRAAGVSGKLIIFRDDLPMDFIDLSDDLHFDHISVD